MMNQFFIALFTAIPNVILALGQLLKDVTKFPILVCVVLLGSIGFVAYFLLSPVFKFVASKFRKKRKPVRRKKTIIIQPKPWMNLK